MYWTGSFSHGPVAFVRDCVTSLQLFFLMLVSLWVILYNAREDDQSHISIYILWFPLTGALIDFYC